MASWIILQSDDGQRADLSTVATDAYVRNLTRATMALRWRCR